MRDIKFRQPILERDQKFNQWHYWGNVNGEWASPAINTNGTDTRDNSQQYTGLKDKNGKDIFEGDICVFSDWKPKPIFWEDGFYKLGNTLVLLCKMEASYMKVIGNIYENPDLIK